ncbi:MAG: MBL fold metallo-hydrolase [Oscillospiraceae bacterium]
MAKGRKLKPAAILLFCLAACALTLLGVFLSSRGEAVPPLTVTLLKVGKADAIVLRSEGHAMVIDTGEEDDGEELVAFLENQGIHRVDALIITHFDRDHVGGADTLIEKMEVGQIYLPAYRGDSSDYLDFIAALSLKGLVPQELTQAIEFDFMAARVLVEPPPSYETVGGATENDNNFSLVTTVIHGDNRLLFAGDAEKQRIRGWLSGGTAAACDFLKMPHHGVYNTALNELLESVSPQYAVICSSEKHPADKETMALLKQKSITAFETKDGDVTLISDGSRLKIHQ